MLGDDDQPYSEVPEEVEVGKKTEGFPHQSKYPFVVAVGLFLLGFGLSFPSTLWAPMFGDAASKGWPSVAFILLVGAPVTLWGVGGWAWEYAVEDYEDDLIPEQKRQLLGMKTAMAATWLFIVSEALVFAGLFVAYFYLEADKGPWPPEGLPPHDLSFALVLTAVLVASGVTMYWAKHALRRGNRTQFNVGLAATIALGLAFIAGQAFEYSRSLGEGLTPFAGAYGSTFYVVTGTHGAHVILGLVLLGVMAGRAWFRGHFDEDRHAMVEAVGYYWHFVDAIWLLIVLFVYF